MAYPKYPKGLITYSSPFVPVKITFDPKSNIVITINGIAAIATNLCGIFFLMGNTSENQRNKNAITPADK